MYTIDPTAALAWRKRGLIYNPQEVVAGIRPERWSGVACEDGSSRPLPAPDQQKLQDEIQQILEREVVVATSYDPFSWLSYDPDFLALAACDAVFPFTDTLSELAPFLLLDGAPGGAASYLLQEVKDGNWKGIGTGQGYSFANFGLDPNRFQLCPVSGNSLESRELYFTWLGGSEGSQNAALVVALCQRVGWTLDYFQAQLYLALQALRVGGSLVARFYHGGWPDSLVSTLYLISSCFDKMVIHKPLCSSATTDECYLICWEKAGPAQTIQVQDMLGQIPLDGPQGLADTDLPAPPTSTPCPAFLNWLNVQIRYPLLKHRHHALQVASGTIPPAPEDMAGNYSRFRVLGLWGLEDRLIQTSSSNSHARAPLLGEIQELFLQEGWDVGTCGAIAKIRLENWAPELVKEQLLALFFKWKVEYPFKDRYTTTQDAERAWQIILKKVRPISRKPEAYYLNEAKKLGITPAFRLTPKVKVKDASFLLIEPDPDVYQAADWLVDFFTERSRMRGARELTSLSPMELWARYDDAYTGAGIGWALKQDIFSLETLREGLYKTGSRNECGHESATALKSILAFLGLGAGGRFFDACAGWGDRFLASTALGAEYVGVDPNLWSQPGFAKLSAFVGSGRVFPYSMPVAPEILATEFGGDGSFDICFMSPPAFGGERYSDHVGQSTVRSSNQDLQTWLKQFLFPCLEQSWQLLKVGGYLVVQSMISIEDILPYMTAHYPKAAFFCGPISVSFPSRSKPMWCWYKRKAGKDARYLSVAPLVKIFQGAGLTTGLIPDMEEVLKTEYEKLVQGQTDPSDILELFRDWMSKLPKKAAKSGEEARSQERADNITALIAQAGVPIPRSFLDLGSGPKAEIALAVQASLEILPEFSYVLDPKLDPDSEMATHLTPLKYKGRGAKLRIPLPDNSVDLVLLNVVLHHIDPSTRKVVIAEVARVLSPKGLVVLREHDDIGEPTFRAYIELVHLIWYAINDEKPDPLYLMSRTETQTLLKTYGNLTPVGFRTYGDSGGPQRLYHESYQKGVSVDAIPFPYLSAILPSLPAMLENLRKASPESLEQPSKITTRRWPSDYKQVDWVGNYFSEHARMQCNKVGLPSPYTFWEQADPELKRDLLFNQGVEAANDWLYTSRGTYICNNFSPQYGLNIILDTVGKGAVILDPSAGWGDRLIAAIASEAQVYVGIDPNPDLQPIYKDVIERVGPLVFKGLEGDSTSLHQRFQVLQRYFEQTSPKEGVFDLALTSPPYYTFEEYKGAQEGLTYPQWLEVVYTPYLEKMFQAVKAGGWVVLYVENLRYEREIIPLRDDTIRVLDGLGGIRQPDYILLTVNDSGLGKPKERRAVAWRKPEETPGLRLLTGAELSQLGEGPRFQARTYFPSLTREQADGLQFTDVSLYSTTYAGEADTIARHIATLLGGHPDTLTIVDATANVGGDTIGFWRSHFKKVVAIEIDPTTFSALKNNVELIYHIPPAAVELIQGDFTRLYRDGLGQPDVVYIDAPWGGPDYKVRGERISLELSGEDVLDIAWYLLQHNNSVRMVALKVPLNFDQSREKVARFSLWTPFGYEIRRYGKPSYNLVGWYKT